jgi:hypothetical protein
MLWWIDQKRLFNSSPRDRRSCILQILFRFIFLGLRVRYECLHPALHNLLSLIVFTLLNF